MGILIIKAIRLFCGALQFMLIVRALMSWVVRDPYSTVGKIYQAVIQFTEPMVAPIRALQNRFFGQGMMIDWSVLIAYFAIELISNILISIVGVVLF